MDFNINLHVHDHHDSNSELKRKNKDWKELFDYFSKWFMDFVVDTSKRFSTIDEHGAEYVILGGTASSMAESARRMNSVTAL